MKIKCILGFCAFKGCKKRGIYTMTAKLPNRNKSFKVCENHLCELMSKAVDISAEVETTHVINRK